MALKGPKASKTRCGGCRDETRGPTADGNCACGLPELIESDSDFDTECESENEDHDTKEGDSDRRRSRRDRSSSHTRDQAPEERWEPMNLKKTWRYYSNQLRWAFRVWRFSPFSTLKFMLLNKNVAVAMKLISVLLALICCSSTPVLVETNLTT